MKRLFASFALAVMLLTATGVAVAQEAAPAAVVVEAATGEAAVAAPVSVVETPAASEDNTATATPASEPFVWWKFLTALFTHAVLPIVGTVFALLITAGANSLLKRLGLEANKVTDDLIWSAADKATSYADEWATKQLKAGEKPESAQKLQTAVGKAREFLSGTGLDKIVEEKLVAYIESKLNTKRAPAAVVVGAAADPSQ